MFGHELASGVAGMILSLFAPLAQTALVAPATGNVDCGIWTSKSGITVGSATELTWWSMNASHATITETGSQSVSVPPSGNRSVSPNTSRTYTLFVANQYGQSKTCSVAVQVAPTTTQAPSCTLTVPPGTYTAGQPVQLFWVTQNAQAAGITNIGTIDASRLAYGNADVYPSQNTLYTMTVANSSGSRTCSALVTLTQRHTTTTRPTATTYTVPRTVSTPSYTARPTSSSAPSYRPTYTALPSYSYGGGSNSMYRDSYYPTYYEETTYYSPSYEYGLGDYSLTNVWNDFGRGEYISRSPGELDYHINPGKYDTTGTDLEAMLYGNDTSSASSWTMGGNELGTYYYSPETNIQYYPAMEWGIGSNDTGYYNQGTVIDMDTVQHANLYDPFLYSGSQSDPVTNYGPQVWSPDYIDAQTNYNWDNPIIMDFGSQAPDTTQNFYPTEYIPADYNSWQGDEGWI